MKNSETIKGIRSYPNVNQSESANTLGGSFTTVTNESITLYHVSKSGIHGAIAPISREEANRTKDIAMADEICRKYRRQGRLFELAL